MRSRDQHAPGRVFLVDGTTAHLVIVSFWYMLSAGMLCPQELSYKCSTWYNRARPYVDVCLN
jgi:hypothetical protein